MQTSKISVDKIIPAPYNPRMISDAALAGLAKSLERFGYVEPIVWNKQTGHIVGGHQRFEILKKTEKKIDCIVVDLDEVEERALNVTLNNQAIQGEWNLPALETILTGIKDFPEFGDLKLDELLKVAVDDGFAKKEIVNDDFDEEKESAVKSEEGIKSQLGDVWLCGQHRVMCGDSCNEADVKKLLGDCIPGLMVTDPPYGVEYDPAWREEVDGARVGGKRSTGKVENDDRADWGAVWNLWKIPVIYCWHSGKYAGGGYNSLTEAGYEIISQIVWVKQHFVLSRGDYHWKHESCFYAVLKNAPHAWQGSRDQTTVWEIKNNNAFGNSDPEEKMGHGTQKPVECMAIPIRNNSQVGDLVCDPFLGSGTTLVAAEQLGRICYGMEIKPEYCDMTVKRWEKMTNKKAELKRE